MDSVLLFADSGLHFFFSGALKGIAALCTWKNVYFQGISAYLALFLYSRLQSSLVSSSVHNK